MAISAGLSRYANNATTTLNGAINSSVTTIVVTSALGFPNPGPFRILIDNEQIQVTAGYGTTSWTVARGVDGTAAASHLTLAPVTNNITAFDYNQYRQEFNVLAYGAIGDGVADESTAFQNAINDAHALTPGGHIYLPNLSFKVNSTLTTYANVVFLTFGATLSGTGVASIAPLIKFTLTGALTIPAALVVSSGGANITGGLIVSGTTTFNTVAYTWPGTAGSSGQFLQTNGSGTVSWQTVVSGVTTVTGTTNQVTASPTSGAVVVSLPSGGTLPGSWTAASGFTVTTGGLTVSAGGLTVSASGANIVGGITGTIATAAQGNITSLGTLTGLTVVGVTNIGANASNTVPTLGTGTGTGTGAKLFITGTDPAGNAANGDMWAAG
jgi:hypothetical protein